MESTRTYTYGELAVVIEWYAPDAPSGEDFEDEDYCAPNVFFFGEATITGCDGEEITGEITTEWEPANAQDFPSLDICCDALDELINE